MATDAAPPLLQIATDDGPLGIESLRERIEVS
jgi:hypothetical protein